MIAPWIDQDVSPAQFVPAGGDAAQMSFDANKLSVGAGRIGPVAIPNDYFAAYRRGDWTLDGSSRISQWNDSSGNGNHAIQPTAGRRPTISGDGYAVMRTSSGNGCVLVPQAPMDAAISAKKLTVVLRMKFAGYVSSNMFLARADSFGNGHLFLLSNKWFRWNPGAVDCTAPNDFVLNTRAIFAFSGNWTGTGNGCSFWSTNALGAHSTTTTAGSPSLNPGFAWSLGSAYAENAYPLNADVEDVWIFPRVLTDDEIDAFRDLP